MVNITVIGGGSAGWMVAAYLAKHTTYKISLIESSKIPIIGVGESTFASLIDFLESIGIYEQDLFENCSAVRKYTIHHHNWNGENEVWNHRFCYNEKDNQQQDYWMENYIKPTEKWRWGYHVDATRLGTLIKEKSALPNGVEYIIDDIEDIVLNGNYVTKLIGKNKEYEADLFIDCTGFRSIIRGKLPIKKKSHPALINNCAVCGPGTYIENEQPLPYTQTYSMDYGWRWRVSLQHRTGNGYAFNKDMISIEDAKKEFINKASGLIIDKIFIVDIDNSYVTEPWMNNVVAFGLSCGFLEPLEATGLYLIYGPLPHFVRLLDNPNGAKIYNKLWNNLYTHVSEFVSFIFSSSKLNHTDYWKSIPKIDKIEPKPVNFRNKIWIDYNYRSLANSRNLEYISPYENADGKFKTS